MSLYYKKGVKGSAMRKIDTVINDFDLLASIVEKMISGQILTFNNKEEKEKYKSNDAFYFIAGEMKDHTYRSNANMISRSLLIIDIDDLEIMDNKLIDCIKNANNRSRMRVIAYPTISHSHIDKKSRYRVIFDLDRSVNDDEYKRLIKGVTSVITSKWCNIKNYKRDDSNATFSQLQGLPVKTTENTNAPILINIDGKPLYVDGMLEKFKNNNPINDNKPISFTGCSMDDREVVRKILRSKQGYKFKKLLTGDISDYKSPSEARIALINILIFWTGGDVETIEAIMWGSDMKKDKWNSKRAGKPFITYEIEQALKKYSGDIYEYEPYQIHIKEKK